MGSIGGQYDFHTISDNDLQRIISQSGYCSNEVILSQEIPQFMEQRGKAEIIVPHYIRDGFFRKV